MQIQNVYTVHIHVGYTCGQIRVR